jgi:hypothetical protein
MNTGTMHNAQTIITILSNNTMTNSSHVHAYIYFSLVTVNHEPLMFPFSSVNADFNTSATVNLRTYTRARAQHSTYYTNEQPNITNHTNQLFIY